MLKKRLFIIGAGGFGRQLESYLEMIPETHRDWELHGYLDDNSQALEKRSSNYQVVGSISSYQLKSEDKVLLALSDINSKKRIVSQLNQKVIFETYIAKDALIGPNVKLGKGVIICPGAKIGANVSIGDFTMVNLNTIIGHDTTIGNFGSIMPHVDIGGNSNLGNEIFLGTKATVAPGISVTDETHMGIGTVTIKDITEKGTYFGNPSRRML